MINIAPMADGLKNLVLLISVVVFVKLWIGNKSFFFDESEIIRLTQKHIGSQTFGQDHRTSFGAILKELRRNHGGAKSPIINDGRLEWIWTRFGGLVGSSMVLHSSLTEFVAFYGTAVETSGLTGRCFLNLTATIVQGSVKQWVEGQTTGKRYIPGESVRLPPGQASALQIDSSSWMVVYGRGLPLTCLPVLVLDSLLPSLDLFSVFHLFKQNLFGFLHSYLPSVICGLL